MTKVENKIGRARQLLGMGEMEPETRENKKTGFIYLRYPNGAVLKVLSEIYGGKVAESEPKKFDFGINGVIEGPIKFYLLLGQSGPLPEWVPEHPLHINEATDAVIGRWGEPHDSYRFSLSILDQEQKVELARSKLVDGKDVASLNQIPFRLNPTLTIRNVPQGVFNPEKAEALGYEGLDSLIKDIDAIINRGVLFFADSQLTI